MVKRVNGLEESTGQESSLSIHGVSLVLGFVFSFVCSFSHSFSFFLLGANRS